MHFRVVSERLHLYISLTHTTNEIKVTNMRSHVNISSIILRNTTHVARKVQLVHLLHELKKENYELVCIKHKFSRWMDVYFTKVYYTKNRLICGIIVFFKLIRFVSISILKFILADLLYSITIWFIVYAFIIIL